MLEPNREAQSPEYAARARTALRVIVAVAFAGIAVSLGAAVSGSGAWVTAAPAMVALLLAGALTTRTLQPIGRVLESQPGEEDTDPLTALASARKLHADLKSFLTRATEQDRQVLLLFMLEGLKRYNDSFGYACGDALLAWLGGKLESAVAERGVAYRLRGGDFAVVCGGPDQVVDAVRSDATRALSEIGGGFAIWCSHGDARLPREASTGSEALKLADRRAQAERTRPHTGAVASARANPTEDPIAALRIARSRYDVAQLASAIARRMGIGGPELGQLEAGAQLRDVGNMAIPTSILSSDGELTDSEWRFIQLHTLVGERLLAANFGMEEVARIVRASHERWDGRGYPDQLAGTEIPIGARIVFVCSAFQDMTSERAHRSALDAATALEELERNAGTQFDPAVVEAFKEEFAHTRLEAPVLERPPTLPRMRVLVAEDDPASRFLLRLALEAGGHECIAAEDGIQAWELFQERTPEVVVSDWLMPGLDGDALCRRIRDDPNAPYAYFIMLTAVEDKEHVLRGMQAGVDDFLTKPLDRQDLEMSLIAAMRVTALHRRVHEQQQAIQAEIDLAASIQRGLLPLEPPVVPGITLAGRCIPAANVGGDYFDYLVDGDGRLFMMIADVAGHSISSALLMAMTRSIVRREMTSSTTPAALIDAANRALFSDLVSAELFLTAFCAVYEPATRRLIYTCAGHNPPLLRRAVGSVEALETEGAAIGILEDGGYEQKLTALEPGDALLLYTDGVVEAASATGEQYGEGRLKELFAESDGGAPTQTIDHVYDAVLQHLGGGRQQDDVTMLALRVES